MYSMRTFTAALVLLGIVTAQAAIALNPEKQFSQYRLDTWASKDGLPRSVITAITQTPDGFLWVGTGLGIVRFDGASFAVFDPRNTAGLTRAGIGTLAVSTSGDLWAGTDGSGFGELKSGRYDRMCPVPEDKEWSRTHALYWSRDGLLWVGMQHSTLYAPIFCFRGSHLLRKERLNGIVHAFAQDKSGTVWCISDGIGLMKVDPRGPSHVQITNKNGLPSIDLTSLCADADGDLWIGTQTHGVCRYRNGKCTTFTERDGLPSNEVNCIYQDREQCIWIGTSKGVARWYRNRFTAYHTTGGQQEDPVYAIFEDHEGSVWVGARSGLLRFADTKLTPLVTRLRTGRLITLVTPRSAPNGTVWAGTTDSGLVRMNAEGSFDTVLSTATGLPANAIRAICVQRDGTVWIALERCLARYAHGHLTRFPLQSTLTLLKETVHGDIAAVDDKALLRYHNGKVVSRQVLTGINWVFDLELEHDDTVWLGTTSGLARSTRDGVRMAEGWDSNVPALGIAFSPYGKSLWVGTDRGLARYDRGHVRMYSTGQGLPNNNILQLAFDAGGRLWAQGDGGIASLSMRDLNEFEAGRLDHLPAVWYSQEDGYTSSSPNEQPMRSRDGRLYFTSPHALCIVDPAHLPINSHVPSVVIEAATANDRRQVVDSPGDAPPGSGALEVHFAALSFAAPERVHFRYKLEGHDANWIDAGSRRAAYYTNLPPGTYTFRVLASNNDGIWNAQGAAFPITLRPYIWQTVWFQTVGVLIFVLACAGLIRLRLARLNKQNRVLEEKVVERTTALRAAYARLETLATIDGMTGLPNHRQFQERLSTDLAHARRHHHPVCVLLMDVDYFKHYNDTYGHPAGDDVLRDVAKLLRDGLRDGDFVARYGGEEFVVILSETDKATCHDIAERLRASVAGKPFAHRQVTISIGVAWHDFAESGGEDLVHVADKAMYTAKRSGRNRVSSPDDIAREPVNPGFEPEDRVEQDINPWPMSCASLSILDNPEALLQEPAGQVLYELLSALDQGRWELPGHTVRSVQFALRLAQEVTRMEDRHITPGDLRELTTGALLHDIGMAAIPLDVDKINKMSRAERQQLEQHPVRGAGMLQGLPHLEPALPVVLSHHECWDGSGYPSGLVGEQIPLSARIFAVSDAVEAMSRERNYAPARDDEQIRAEIARQAGKQFDPEVVSAYLKIPPEEWKQLRGMSRIAERTSTESLQRAA